MLRLSPGVTAAVVVAAGAMCAAASDRNDDLSVSVKVSHEAAPPGGMAQMKIRMTNDKPIITGSAKFSFGGFARIDGINIVSPDDDAAGLAIVRGTDVTVSAVSPNGTFGTDSDYPLLTVVGRVPLDAPIGQVFPMVLRQDALRLIDPSGAPYPTEAKSGQLMSWPSVAIHDVVPGSATLPAGSVVSIHGSNFRPDTEIRFNESEMTVAQVRYLSSTRVDVVIGDPTSMHGLEIEARNRDGSRSTYFSYQRTSRAGKSGHTVLRDVVPLFRNRATADATLQLSGAVTGLALQNLDRSDATVFAELSTTSGRGVAAAVVTVPSNQFLVRQLSEIFRVRNVTSGIVRLTSATPVQVLGVSVDSAGAATPVLPR
jgi:hypothetical protein